MAFRDCYDVRNLINVSERLVFDAIDAVMPGHPEMCKCEDCMLDVAAIALNSLPPRYRAGKFISLPKNVPGLRNYVPEEEREMVEQARAAVEAAIERVKKHPNH